MTTITMERASVEKWLEGFVNCDFVNCNSNKDFVGYAIKAETMFRAALAAPATAPVPAWHDALTCAGLWVCDYFGKEISVTEFNDHEVKHFDRDEMIWCRWYGPIPEDKQ